MSLEALEKERIWWEILSLKLLHLMISAKKLTVSDLSDIINKLS